jgi:HSP20 family protein
MTTSLNIFDPWRNLEQIQDEMNRLLNRRGPGDEQNSVSDWVPAVDIKETDDCFMIHADIPGVNPDDIEVHTENGMLTIKGERSSEKKASKQGYKRIERAYGSFFRRFNLPDTADAEHIKASCKNGVLEVTIPKQSQVQPKRISIES